MLDRRRILELIPHQGSMSLLDRAVSWDALTMTCQATSHFDPTNPLRRAGRLAAVCGIEYGLQAAALHGAVSDGRPQPPGYLAGLSEVAVSVDRLDDPAFGTLAITATLELREATGLIYAFRVESEDGRSLVAGHATVRLRSP